MYAYLWYDLRHNAIKIGVAQVPTERMVSYAVEFNLTPEVRSLTTVLIPEGSGITVHNHLMRIFIEGLELKPVDGFQELFRLGERYVWSDIRQLFEITVRDIVMFVTTADRSKQRRRREAAEDRVIEWRDINNGGSH